MQIILIEDVPTVLQLMTVFMRKMGHTVRAFESPRTALAALTPDVDLVVSDIGMPELSGFEVAEQVQAKAGSANPKVLLISGEDHALRLVEYPPSIVIGILMKPVMFVDLSRVLSCLEQTRACCPGVIHAFCPVVERDPAIAARQAGTRPCHTTTYGMCPYYDALCGPALRRWIDPRAQRDKPAVVSV